MDRENDCKLIEETLNGNLGAFNQLVKKHEVPVAKVIKSMLGNCIEADDVGQEVFISFYKNLSKFRHESGIKTYLIRIAINLSINELKKRKRQKSRFTNYQDINLAKNYSEQPSYELKEIIEAAVDRLDTKMKPVVILRLIEGYSTKETSEILKIPEGTVLSRLARAQELLRNSLIKRLRDYDIR